MAPPTKNSLLIKALQKREHWALKQLYNTYWKKMFVYAYKIIADQALCEDIVQDIFVSIWEKAPNSDIQHLESYLFKALKYKIANSLRDAKYTRINEGVIAKLPSENNTKTTVEFQDLEKQVLQILDTLPKKCRNVFYLSRIEDYNNLEIAQELNISVRTVETHISKALKHFRFHFSHLLTLTFMLLKIF
ncbi:RNA polymerase sigma factor [Galbibacter pacificus]|uniref:RNA polymerase sigma-70 factor n=1 Tax=Galbibacter pacificus TaxID=2996052 RepID=A0ABT6FNS2_9FLAO|nr:RNA polymerase sigma-70 factor [Galbibacter pacificus]MDG3581382.1 RNA polymerase sigma-70 factor [Galbibacter pacificus]MDG3584860.1 RNA polymerase sigma-70 factor [Galbibacter pacificus]